jgi:hypothetical protein
MKILCLTMALLCGLPGTASAGQIIAGSPEDKMLQSITAESNPDSKLQMLMNFEKQFPQSRALPDVYNMLIELYRQKGDRAKVIEYGEKTLKLDANNVTALMVLSRNYAMEQDNLDRAVTLAQRAVDQLAAMKSGPKPQQFSDAQWQDYLQTTESVARGILGYAKAIQARKKAPGQPPW